MKTIFILSFAVSLLCMPCNAVREMAVSVLRNVPAYTLAAAQKTVKVKGYTKKNGTYVPPHTRKAPSHKKKR